MIFVFYLLAIVLIWFSYKSFRGGVDYLRYFKQELSKPSSEFTPFATIIVPCRGLDNGLKENLSALLDQNYPGYEVIFVADDENDPALTVIEDLKDSASLGIDGDLIKAVVAPKATGASQKVENLREAVLHTSELSEIFVFADSDVRPSPDWLRSLVAPLENDPVGAATGYRWFISKKPTLASEMRNMWNASIASALGPNTKSNFCWGGSMAVRKETFEKLNLRDRWSGTLSDDFTVTRAMNEAGLEIRFVPQALTPSIENCSLREMFEFTNRQMKITRVYAPHLWLMSFFGSGLFNVVMVAAFLIVILSSTNSFGVWFALAAIFAVSLLSIGKSTLRLFAVRTALAKYKTEIRRQFFSQNVLWLLAPALFFVNCVAALFSRRINWRGTVYEMASATETRILRRAPKDKV